MWVLYIFFYFFIFSHFLAKTIFFFSSGTISCRRETQLQMEWEVYQQIIHRQSMLFSMRWMRKKMSHKSSSLHHLNIRTWVSFWSIVHSSILIVIHEGVFLYIIIFLSSYSVIFCFVSLFLVIFQNLEQWNWNLDNS